MVATVPSLEGSLYLTDPQSICAYVLRRYFRQPADTVPILGDQIISLPYQVAKFGKEPNNLIPAIQVDLGTCLNRIFANDRQITVTCSYSVNDSNVYDITISVMYTTAAGELNQLGTTIQLGEDGRLIIPEDILKATFLQNIS